MEQFLIRTADGWQEMRCSCKDILEKGDGAPKGGCGVSDISETWSKTLISARTLPMNVMTLTLPICNFMLWAVEKVMF